MSGYGGKSHRANGTIRVSRFVKLDPSDNNSILEADANERTFGISQAGGSDAPVPLNTTDPVEAGQAGSDVMIHGLGEYATLRAGSGGWAANDRLKSDADGNGVVIASTGTTIQNIGAVAITAAAAGEVGLVRVAEYSERPALT